MILGKNTDESRADLQKFLVKEKVFARDTVELINRVLRNARVGVSREEQETEVEHVRQAVGLLIDLNKREASYIPTDHQVERALFVLALSDLKRLMAAIEEVLDHPNSAAGDRVAHVLNAVERDEERKQVFLQAA